MKAAFFDLDGVLVEGYTNVNFIAYMAKKEFVDENFVSELSLIGRLYRSGKITYTEAALKVNLIIAKAVKGLDIDLVAKENKKYIKTLQYLSYTKQLLKKFNGAKKFLVSAAQDYNVADVAKHMEMDGFAATIMDTSNGKYTGKIKSNLSIIGKKRYAALELAKKYGVDLNTSFAFGDTENDLEFLELVGTPVAVNPNAVLLTIAIERGWVVMDKNNYRNVMSDLV